MAILGTGLYKTYQWQTETNAEAFVRGALLIAGGAYLLHVVADACTAKSIPLIGRI